MRTPARLFRTPGAAILFTTLMLTNCWKVNPDLVVSTNELNFGTGKYEATVTVTNDSKDNALTSGVTALDYQFKSDRGWITVTPVSGHLDGEQSGTHAVVIARSELTMGDNVATITVTSNGGSETITVLATRTGDSCSDVPSTPSAPGPDNDAEGVPLSAVLSWEGGDSECDGFTATYDVYFGTATTPPFHHNNGSSKSWDPPALESNTLYYWRVVARDANGSTTSTTWSFRTIGNATCEAGPDALSLLSPAADATNVSLDQNLSWSGGESQCPELTATYDVYFGTSSPPPLHHDNGTSKSWDPGALEQETTYYWRIVAKDANGTRSSSERTFRTRACDISLTAPCNPAPRDDKDDVNPKMGSLSWQCGIVTAAECDVDVTYVVYLGRTADLTESHRFGTTTSQSIKLSGTLQGNTTYYWKVVARADDVSRSSPVWTFETR